MDGEQVIGMVLAYRRVLEHSGSHMVLGGIGSVYVARKHRGAGIARRLVRAVMTELGRAGCDLAFLYANLDDRQLVRLYGGAGFVPLGRPYSSTGRSGTRYNGKDGMIASVRSPSVFAEVLSQSAPFDIGHGNWQISALARVTESSPEPPLRNSEPRTPGQRGEGVGGELLAASDGRWDSY